MTFEEIIDEVGIGDILDNYILEHKIRIVLEPSTQTTFWLNSVDGYEDLCYDLYKKVNEYKKDTSFEEDEYPISEMMLSVLRFCIDNEIYIALKES